MNRIDPTRLPVHKCLATDNEQGSTTSSVHYVKSDFPIRLLRKIHFLSSGCWLWTGAKSSRPGWPQHAYPMYAVTTRPPRMMHAHKFAYEWELGPVPVGLEIDHTCRNKLCVNPEHMEAVTHQENCKRRLRSGPLPGYKLGPRKARIA
jgi:hypothetical protein